MKILPKLLQPSLRGLALLALLGSASAQAQLLKPSTPGNETPRSDVTRKAPGSVVAGPGTQTEDDVYIGRKVQAGTPAAATKAVAPKAPTVKATVLPKATGKARSTGEDDEDENSRRAKGLAGKARGTGDEDELDVQRRKAQGLPEKPGAGVKPAKPGTETPQVQRK